MASDAPSPAEKMQYVRLGSTGLQVSKLCLGMMSYGLKSWAPWVLEEEEALPVIGKAWEAGINFWDTANIYSNGESEIITGHALQRFNIPRERVVIATKLYFSNHPDEPLYVGSGKPPRPGAIDRNRRGLSRKCIMQEVDASLKRLGTDYIDLYQIHRWDNETPIEETMSALNDLVRVGKVRYLGASSMWAWQFSKAQYTAKMNGWAQFVSMQNYYNLLYREEEREMIPLLQDMGVGMIPWSPLAAGALTGRNRGTTRESSARTFLKIKDADDAIVDRCVEVAKKKCVTASQVALAWMYSKKFVTSPICGISKLTYLYDLIGALDVKLDEEEIKFLEEPYIPHEINGHA
ncbi:aldo/keto reductase [Gonapodya prolifera JEL478]|uniref:Aldo/keto reductase n=1 Tax=Gonapodya prolifera (strain JEL478) TaxID=1344416 RepID=A0A139A4W6_GONPJ|nr:aldo/keto reductase [Gonapodya prolifera JEL478]|eukprot:KXS11784.1 aldo/keto reductase [Gonapodya prolifera JEL478]